jgi:flagellar biosynthesis/type III secretory pathway chaperone
LIEAGSKMQPADSYSTIVAEQVRCAEAMLEALATEARALGTGKADELAAASAAKAKLVEQLEALESQRRELLGSVPIDSSTPLVARLFAIISECRKQNERNGALLNARADNVRVALKALRGSEPDLYNPSGRAPARAGARRLGTA